MSRGPLEPKVMEVLISLREGTVRDVHKEISRERKVSINAIATVLSRLHEKGLVERFEMRGRGGKVYVYRPRVGIEEYRRSVVRRAIDRVVAMLGTAALPKFLEESASRLSREELEEILRRVGKDEDRPDD